MSQRRVDYTMTEREFHAIADKVRRLSMKEYDGSYTPVCYDQLQSAIDARDIEESGLPLAVVKAVANKGPSRYWVVAATDLEKRLQELTTVGEPA